MHRDRQARLRLRRPVEQNPAVGPSVQTDAQEIGEGRTYLRLVPLLLALALPTLYFLPLSVAAPTAVRIFIVLFLLMAGIDFLTLKVPNLLVYPSIGFALFATLIVDDKLFVDAILGGAGLLGLLFVVALIGRGAMGMGDVKVACFVGCCFGFHQGFLALLFSFAAGGCFALIVLLLRLRRRGDVTALTPFMAGGAIAYGLIVGFLLGPAY